LKKIIKEIFFNNIALTCNFAELIRHGMIQRLALFGWPSVVDVTEADEGVH